MPLYPFKFLHTLFLSPTNSRTHTQEFVAFITPRLLDKNQKQDVDVQVRSKIKKLGFAVYALMSETKPIFTNLKEKIRAHRASSKATRLFLTK